MEANEQPSDQAKEQPTEPPLTKPDTELTQEERSRRWRRAMAELAKKPRAARKLLAESVARRNEFQYLDETIGRKPERFPKILDMAAADYVEGRFFLEQLSLFYQVSPQLSLTVYELRQEWVRQYDLKTVPELLLLDQAMLAYFHVVRANKEVGSMFSLIEDYLVYPDDPFVEIAAHGRQGLKVDHFSAEDHLRKLQDMLLPMIERFNLMFLRNLKALRELRGNGVNISIGQAGQVNLGQQQVNVAGGG